MKPYPQFPTLATVEAPQNRSHWERKVVVYVGFYKIPMKTTLSYWFCIGIVKNLYYISSPKPLY
ncbi:MAG: hypothetical protein ACPG49_11170 [Chitinophagales bacterium]